MIKLYLKQKVFSWNNKFAIKNEFGEDKYFVEGEVFTLGRKLHIFDQRGNKVASAIQEINFGMPKYNIFCGGMKVATVKQEFAWFNKKVNVEGLDWHVDGKVFTNEYEIVSSFKPIAHITKNFLGWSGDTYEIQIYEQEDELKVLAVALTLDCIFHEED